MQKAQTDNSYFLNNFQMTTAQLNFLMTLTYATILLQEPLLLLASSQLRTRQKPCHHCRDDGCLPLADTCQKREEQTISGHSKDNTWKWKHGPKETKPKMKKGAGGGGGGGRDFKT